MENQTTALQIQDYTSIFQSESMKLQKLDKTIQLVSAIREFEPLFEQALDVAKNVFDSCLKLQELELRLDYKLANNRERREVLLKAFQNCIDHLQRTTNTFLERIELAPDEKSKDRYAGLLIDVLNKSENLTLQLLRII